MGIFQDTTLPAHGLGDQEGLALRVVEAGRMELHELHVRNRRPRAPRHGDPVARGDVGIRRVQVDAPASSGGQHRHIGAKCLHLPRGLIQNIEADTGILHGIAQFTRGDEVHGHVVFKNGDAGMRSHRIKQGLLDLESGRVLGMKDPALRVPPFPTQVGLLVPLGCRAFIEMHPETDQFGNPLRSLRDNAPDHILVAEPIPRNKRVPHMKGYRVLATGHAGDAALGPGGVGISARLLGHDGYRTLFRRLQGIGKPCNPAADHDMIEGFHRERRKGMLSIRRTLPRRTATRMRPLIQGVSFRKEARVDSSTISA